VWKIPFLSHSKLLNRAPASGLVSLSFHNPHSPHAWCLPG
jgi:hypothetical protein